MEPFIGEIRGFGFNFVPIGWTRCDGHLLSIAQYDTLFAVIGTIYGGDGVQTFATPNLQGTTMVNQGQGPGLSNWVIGEVQGTNTVTLTQNQMPVHNHQAVLESQTGGTGDMVAQPVANYYMTRYAPAGGGAGVTFQKPPLTSPVVLNNAIVGSTGGSQPHENQQPYLALTWCIATEGIFPSRN